MIDWKGLGKNVLTLGVGYLIERVVAKRVPASLTELFTDLAHGRTEKVPPELKQALDVLIDAQLRESFRRAEDIGKQMEASLDKLKPPLPLPPKGRRK